MNDACIIILPKNYFAICSKARTEDYWLSKKTLKVTSKKQVLSTDCASRVKQ